MMRGATLAGCFLACAFAALPRAAPADQAGYLYSYALNESRFGDFVYSVDAYKPFGTSKSSVRPFVDVFGNIDSKTSGGLIPRIYSDNYAGAAVGLQYTNASGLRIFAQAGATMRLGAVASVPSGGDVRGGVQLYREWGGPAAHRAGYGNFYGSGTYYSRYQDTVFYNQLELGTRTSPAPTATEFYLRPVFTMDSKSYYYDNLIELTAGVRFHPFGTHGPTFALEEAAGTYTNRSGLPASLGASYFDFRPTISYGVSL